MKKLAVLAASLLAFNAQAAIIGSGEIQWGIAQTIDFTLFNADGTFDVDEVDGGTEVTLYCDDGAGVTAGSDFQDEGPFYSLALTAAETRCARLIVSVGPSGPIEVMGLTTVGCHGAQTPSGVVRCGTASAGSNAPASITLDGSASATTDAYQYQVVRIIGGTGVGQTRKGTAYNGTTKVLTVNRNWVVVPDSTSIFQVFYAEDPIVASDVNGNVSADVKLIDGDAAAAVALESYTDGSDRMPVDLVEINGSTDKATNLGNAFLNPVFLN